MIIYNTHKVSKKKNSFYKACLILICLLFPFISYGQTVEKLQCNYVQNPLGIDDAKPLLSWNIVSNARGERQAAYQVLVASSKELLAKDKGDYWNSNKVLSEQNLYVPYGGIALKSGMKYYWKVRIWNNKSKVSSWSNNAFWTMGLLAPQEWKAKWITASKWFVPKKFRPKGVEVLNSGGWTDVDLGKQFTIDKICLYPDIAIHFPSRFTLESSDELYFKNPRILVDFSRKDYQLSGTGAQEFKVDHIKTRFIRLRIMADTTRKSDFTVRQLQVFSNNENVALMKFMRENGTRWSRGHSTFLVDGMPSHQTDTICPPDACPVTTAPLFRKSFYLKKSVKKATIYYAALGMADISLNGKKVSNEELGPKFTDYSKRISYLTKDITSLLKNGENVLGAILGNGYFSPPGRGFGKRHWGNGPPRLMIQAEIEFEDGSSKTVLSDETWQWAKSEIILNDLWGEYHEDRQQAITGWDKPGFLAAGSWLKSVKIDALKGKLTSSITPPIRINGILKPFEVKNNTAKFNVMTAGWPQVKVNGKAGQTITIKGTGENLKLPDLRFTLAKDGPAVLQPKFLIYAGASEIKVEGTNEDLNIDDISILQVYSDLDTTASFNSSNPYLNNLYQVVMRTYRNYVYDVPLDPSREKQGWTQDAQNMFNTAAYFNDVKGIYKSWWQDMADNQDSEGYLGSVVPVVNRQVYDWNSPWWSGAIVFLPWEHYKYYGDQTMLKNAYNPMKRYVDFLGKMAATGEGKPWNAYPYFTQKLDSAAAADKMIIWNGAGDWQNPFTTGQFAVPSPMSTMPAYYYYATIVCKTATLLGKEVEATKYRALAEDIKKRFNDKYFNKETGWYGDDKSSQTGQVLPLATGIVPDGKQDLVYKNLLEAIHARQDHIGTGFVATSFLLQTLAKHQESALANKIINQKDYPGWNTLVKDGVLMETWRGHGVQMPSCGGPVGAWLIQSVLGIQPDDEAPGFKKFILAPQPDIKTGLTSAKGHYDSVYGRIISDWKYAEGEFLLHAVIPANTTATIYIPANRLNTLTETDMALENVKEVKLIKIENNVAILRVESGSYYFSSKDLKL